MHSLAFLMMVVEKGRADFQVLVSSCVSSLVGVEDAVLLQATTIASTNIQGRSGTKRIASQKHGGLCDFFRLSQASEGNASTLKFEVLRAGPVGMKLHGNLLHQGFNHPCSTHTRRDDIHTNGRAI